MKTRAKNLKEAASKLNVTISELQKARTRLNNYYGNIPEYMIHGTNGYKWNVEAFKKFL